MKTKEIVNEAMLLKSIGHPIRLNIVKVLLEQESCVKNIWGCLDIPQATVSQHLAILRSRGIVAAHRNGATVWYSVKDPRVARIVTALKGGSR